MIELLIQLVIILIVVASIIKRMKETAQKAEELDKPSPQRPLGDEKQKPTLAEKIQDWSKQFEMQLETPEPKERPGADIESLGQTLDEKSTVIIPGEAEKLPEEIQIAPSPPPYSAPLIKRKPQIQLNFSGSDLIKGIIMSEILGQPVGLRGD